MRIWNTEPMAMACGGGAYAASREVMDRLILEAQRIATQDDRLYDEVVMMVTRNFLLYSASAN